MKNQKKIERQYFATYLSNGIGLLEIYIAGLKHDVRTINDNESAGFHFEECEQVNFIHQLGTVYLFKEYGYVCAGYCWYRFLLEELVILSN